MSTKDQAIDIFKSFKALVEIQLEKKIKIWQSNHGGEYFLNEFFIFCKEHGIIHEYGKPYTLEQNRLAKR